MSELRRLEPSVWDVPVGYVDGMRVPGIVFASDELLARAVEDRAVEQVANVATLPGIVGACYAMPDIHWGYGFPIGGVAATDVAAGGVVSPGGVGFDVLAGDRRAEARSLPSTCHGAGRSMSRTRARKLMSGPDLRRQLEGEGLVLAASNWKLLSEEAPYAYKDATAVVETCAQVGQSRWWPGSVRPGS